MTPPAPFPSEPLELTLTWLQDLIEAGLGREEPTRPAFWHEQAARLVDAKLPGLARRFRRVTLWPASDMAWAPMVLVELGRIHLLVQAALQAGGLPAEVREELALALRPAPKHETLMARTQPVEDCWRVIGRRVSMEPLGPNQRMRVAETWLLGQGTGRTGVHLGFSPERSSKVGSAPAADPIHPLAELLEGTPAGVAAHFTSRIAPQRLLFRQPGPKFAPVTGALEIPWMKSLTEARAAHLEQLDPLPWLEQFPILVQGLTPLTEDEARAAGCLDLRGAFPAARWVRDAAGECAPVSPLLPEQAWWRWLAFSRQVGAVGCFGVWDPAPYMLPYTLWAPGEAAPRGLFG
jgi:hypothetical protein